jgi:hypothetical protein
MVQKVTPEFREFYRKEYLEGHQAILPVRLGHFMMWFGACEVLITSMITYVLGFDEYPARLEFIMRGLDGRVKCERLRQAAKSLKPLGPNLDARILYFQEKLAPLRNRIAHTWPIEEDGVVFFNTLGKLHFVKFKMDPTLRTEPDSITLDLLLDHGIWLHAFSNDLLAATNDAAQLGYLEVVEPQSHLPTAPPKDQPPEDANAKSDKRAQKRQQK